MNIYKPIGQGQPINLDFHEYISPLPSLCSSINISIYGKRELYSLNVQKVVCDVSISDSRNCFKVGEKTSTYRRGDSKMAPLHTWHLQAFYFHIEPFQNLCSDKKETLYKSRNAGNDVRFSGEIDSLLPVLAFYTLFPTQKLLAGRWKRNLVMKWGSNNSCTWQICPFLFSYK